MDRNGGVAMKMLWLTAAGSIPLTATDSSAQRLLERDGIELRGTALVTYGAGTCNVLEDRETAESYERKKANHGKPVDVWQLDFSVYNGSGKPLDHLIARYRIVAEWPPCTNWTGPTGTYPKQVEWGGAAGHIQESGQSAVAPGETKRDTVFVVVFHEHEPRFENWSLDYQLGEAAVPRGLCLGGEWTVKSSHFQRIQFK